MKASFRLTVAGVLHAALLFSPALAAEATDPLSAVATQADIDAIVAKTTNASQKQAIQAHAGQILAAAKRLPHVEAVVRTITSSPGKFEKVNVTPEALKQALGRDLPVFDSLKLVDLAIPNAGPHDHRKVDPYDAAFFEHLGHIDTLESLNIIATKAADPVMSHIGKLTNLKTLRFTNNGKLTDAGLEQLAGLKNLEYFNYVGTSFTGKGFAKFEPWTKVTRCSFRGSSINDEGLQAIAQALPNLESLSLAHAKFTDAGAPALAKLTKLKGLEIGTRNATPACLAHIAKLKLEYLQLGDGLDAPSGLAIIKDITTLRRLTLTDCKALTDADFHLVLGMSQLETLETNNLALTDERIAQLPLLKSLKTLRLLNRPKAYPPEVQAKIKAVLPKVETKFE